MQMRAKDRLIEPKCNEGGMASNSGSFRESPNPIGKLSIPTAKPLPQLCLHGLLLGGKLDVKGVNVVENREQQLISYILQSYSDLTTGEKEV